MKPAAVSKKASVTLVISPVTMNGSIPKAAIANQAMPTVAKPSRVVSSPGRPTARQPSRPAAIVSNAAMAMPTASPHSW